MFKKIMMFATALGATPLVCAAQESVTSAPDSHLMVHGAENLTYFSSSTLSAFQQLSPQYGHWLLAVTAIGAAILLYILIRAVCAALAHAAPESKTATVRNALFMAVGKPLALIVSGLAIYLGVEALIHGSDTVWHTLWTKLYILFVFIEIAVALCGCVNTFLRAYARARREASIPTDTMLINILGKTIKVILVVFIALVAGDQLGLNITALIAGAGVAGLAVAFAAQDTIANVFGSLTVVADRPFNVGDYVKIDGNEGTVAEVGFRTTRIVNLDGHELIIPNKNCANAIIVNISRRTYIRYLADLGLIYETSPEKVKEAIAILNDIFVHAPGYNKDFPPRIGFSAFKDFALNISVCAFYFTYDASGKRVAPDFLAFGAWTSAINLEILTRFNQAGISFAYPTQVTYLGNLNNSELKVNEKDV